MPVALSPLKQTWYLAIFINRLQLAIIQILASPDSTGNPPVAIHVSSVTPNIG